MVDEALESGSDQMWNGMATMTDPAMERKAKGASQVVRGALAAASPALVPAAAANPVGTLARVGAGMLAQKGVEEGAKALDVPEGYAELAGDVAGLAAGSRDVAGGVTRGAKRVAPGVKAAVKAGGPDVAVGAAKVATGAAVQAAPIPELVKFGAGFELGRQGVRQIGRGVKAGYQAGRGAMKPPPAPPKAQRPAPAWQSLPEEQPPEPPAVPAEAEAPPQLPSGRKPGRMPPPQPPPGQPSEAALQQAGEPWTPEEEALAQRVLSGTEPQPPAAPAAGADYLMPPPSPPADAPLPATGGPRLGTQPTMPPPSFPEPEAPPPEAPAAKQPPTPKRSRAKVVTLPPPEPTMPVNPYEATARASKVANIAKYLHDNGVTHDAVRQLLDESDPAAVDNFLRLAAKQAGEKAMSEKSIPDMLIELKKLGGKSKLAKMNPKAAQAAADLDAEMSAGASPDDPLGVR